jgi:uncharacterized SAM-binding protein YcdF (DUF218 family)
MNRNPPSSSRSCASASLPVLLLTGLVAVLFLYLGLRAAGAYLISGDRLKEVDAVVVLGGGDEQRVAQAVQLVLDQYGHWLIITEPGEVKPGQGPGSQAVISLAVDGGLSPFAIIVTPEISTSTYDEARAVLALMQDRGFQSVLVVTDPYHTQRTGLIFRDAFRGSGLSVRIYPVQNHWYRSDRWFFKSQGWGATVREYAKLAGYLLRLEED